jgi:hypothetical protein
MVGPLLWALMMKKNNALGRVRLSACVGNLTLQSFFKQLGVAQEKKTLSGYDGSSSTPAREGLAMKILSLNSEHTKSEDQIALNVNEELTPELMELVEYGSLTLVANGSVLHVYKGETDDHFDDYFVANLEKKLNVAKDQLNEAARRHRRLQEIIARSTNLPLD